MTAPGLALRPLGRRSLRSRLRGCDDRDRGLTCTRCGAVPTLALPDLVAHACTSRPRRRRAVAAVAGLALLVPGALLLDPRAPAASDRPLRAVVLSGSSLSYADARAAADGLGWDAAVYALPGAGLSRSALDPLGSLTRELPRALAAQPDVLVVQGGEADHVVPPAVLQRAVEDLVRAAGGTRLVLVGPIPAAEPPASTRALNELLARVAAEQQVPYVDALGRGWRVGDPVVPDALAAELARVVQP